MMDAVHPAKILSLYVMVFSMLYTLGNLVLTFLMSEDEQNGDNMKLHSLSVTT